MPIIAITTKSSIKVKEYFSGIIKKVTYLGKVDKNKIYSMSPLKL